jgi:hypothetical protein
MLAPSAGTDFLYLSITAEKIPGRQYDRISLVESRLSARFIHVPASTEPQNVRDKAEGGNHDDDERDYNRFP